MTERTSRFSNRITFSKCFGSHSISTKTSAYFFLGGGGGDNNLGDTIFGGQTRRKAIYSINLINVGSCILEFQMKNIDAKFLKHLQCTSQTTNLIIQRKYDRRFIKHLIRSFRRRGCCCRWCLSTPIKISIRMPNGSIKIDRCYHIAFLKWMNLSWYRTTRSSSVCNGLPSLTAHSDSPLRYSHNPNNPLPDPLIVRLFSQLDLTIYIMHTYKIETNRDCSSSMLCNNYREMKAYVLEILSFFHLNPRFKIVNNVL